MRRFALRGSSLVAVVMLAVASVSCGNPTAPTSIAGSWESGCTGLRSPGGGGCDGLLLNESGDVIRGIAQTEIDGSGTDSVSGTYVPPQVTLFIAPATGGAGVRYEGTVYGGRMTLTAVSGSPQTIVYHRGTGD